jgi:hypothetical protein
MSAPRLTFPYSGGGGGGGISGSGTAGYVAKFTSGTAVGNSLVRDNGTDVSIDMSPSVGFKLSVNGNTNIVGRIDAISSAISTMSSGLSSDLVLQRDGVEAARIIAGGLLGVGCTDPGNTLETYASTASGIRASSDTLANIGIFQNSSNATGASLTMRKARGTRATPSAVTSGDTIGTVQFSAYGTGGNVVSSIASSVVAYTSATNISSNLTFGTSPSGSAAAVTRMTIDQAGNVGIANTTGTILGKLHVGSGTTAPVVTTPGLIVTGSTSEARLVVKESTVGAEWFVLPSTTIVSMGTVNAFPLELKTTNATRITISAAGDTSIANTLSFNSGYGSAAVAYGTRAWVNFDGTGVVAIRGSGNVSTITDLGVGSYSVNFTTAMPDVNYSAHATVGYNGTVGSGIVASVDRNSAVAAVGSVRVYLFSTAFAVADSTMVFVSVSR